MVWLISSARDPIQSRTLVHRHDELTSLQTFRDYGERFDIEDFWMKSPMEQSIAQSPCPACVWFGNRNILLTAQGQQVVA